MGNRLDNVVNKANELNFRVMKMEALLHQAEKDIEGIYFRLANKTLNDIEEIVFRSIESRDNAMHERYSYDTSNDEEEHIFIEGMKHSYRKAMESQVERAFSNGKEFRDKEKITEMLNNGKTAKEIADFCKYPIEMIIEVEKELASYTSRTR